MFRGEEVIIGVGIEDPTKRGTAVTPQVYIPGRTPSGMNVAVAKALLKETKGGGMESQGSEVVQRKASGPIEFNVRSQSIGYLLKSLLGKCTTTTVATTVKSHKFEVLVGNPQFPTFTVGLSQPSTNQDYEYPTGLLTALSMNFPVDDLVNASADIIASDEVEHDAFTVAFDDEDYIFRPEDVTIKIAANIAGLAAASEISFDDFKLDIKNNGKSKFSIGTGVATPVDSRAGLVSVSGSFSVVYDGKTNHDRYVDGDYIAIQITLERGDVAIATTYHPTITIQLDRVSLEASNPDRPMDGEVVDSFDFVGHYDETNSEGINIVVQNEVEDYDYDA